MKIRLRSIRTKLLLMVLAVNAYTLLVASAAFFYHDMSENRERSARELTTLAEILGQGSVTALELQWEFLRFAQKYADEVGLEACGGDDVGGAVLARWESVLTALEHDPMTLGAQRKIVCRSSRLGSLGDSNRNASE